ncbi:MAG TPA: N-acetyl-alpha-D-glucosaminyl L-malate synthase BshA, partial [Candidatus Angelobacter sp.]|nr:N-acetyl-alpha-D-glucosaminyl L-malate synthase BshA [Candidatus Angelobacter sp.]
HEVTVSQYPLFEYPPYDLALATRMAEVAEIYDLDILHVHYAIPHSVSALLARQMLAAMDKPRKLPFVTTLHGTDITIVGADRSYLPVTRYSIEQSDGVTAISNWLKQVTLKEFDIRHEIEVVYNFVNCDTYRRDPMASEKRGEFADADERILVHVSNFRPVKRICDVIEIFDRVHKVMPSRLLLLGDGPDRSQAEWLVGQKGLRKHVEFMGKVDRVSEKLSIADLMLMPSQMESFGLAALEGMACEVPAIATAVGGVPEVIEHGRTGFLAQVGDVETMARCAIDILSDEKRLREMGMLARWEAQSRYCSTKIIPEYEQFYKRVLERDA